MFLTYFKRGLYHSAFLGITAACSRLLSFFFLPYITAQLTVAEFGIWDFYQNFFSLGTQLVASGAACALIRFYILHKDDPIQQRSVIGNAFGVVALLCAALLLLSPCCAYILSAYATLGYFYISVVLTCLFALFSVVVAYAQVIEHLWLYAAICCSQACIATLLTFIGVSYKAGVIAFFYAYCFSFSLFVPLFAYVLYKNAYFSFALLRQQAAYSAPLVLYNIVYMGFFTFDRLFLKYAVGYDALGEYAILWRFGAIFQFFAMSITNAAPFVVFNAQNEKNGTNIIERLITYASIVIISGALAAMVGTKIIVAAWFPKYLAVCTYIPLFFIFMGMLEIARLMQTGFHLARTTWYIPVLSSITLVCQSLLLLSLSGYGIAGICAANIGTFIFYAGSSYFVGLSIYKQHVVNRKALLTLCSLFIICSLLLYSFSIYVLIMISWPLIVWLCVISREERQKIYTFFGIHGISEGVSHEIAEPVVVEPHCYTHGITAKKLVIIGPCPPPIGGISVHVQRVAAKLKRQANDVVVFDTTKWRYNFFSYFIRLTYRLYVAHPDILHYHTPYSRKDIYEFCVLVCMQKMLKFHFVFIEHDAHHVPKLSFIKKRIYAWCVSKLNSMVFIGNTPYISYKKSGIMPQNFSVESAFLPPDTTQESAILQTYPASLFQFLETHTFCVLANAFQLRLVDGIDLYGFDMCIELIHRLCKQYQECGIILALARIGDVVYYQQLQEKIQQCGIANHVYFLHDQKELWPLFKRVNIFVRPTLFDNYGISVAEALFFDIPAVASNVCVRPLGTIVFESRDMAAFYTHVYSVVQHNYPLVSMHEKRRFYEQ